MEAIFQWKPKIVKNILFFIDFFLTFFNTNFLAFFGPKMTSRDTFWGCTGPGFLPFGRSRGVLQRPSTVHKTPPRAHKTPPRHLQGPKSSQDTSKTPPRSQNAPKMVPKSPQEASKSLKFGGFDPSSLPCYVRVP